MPDANLFRSEGDERLHRARLQTRTKSVRRCGIEVGQRGFDRVERAPTRHAARGRSARIRGAGRRNRTRTSDEVEERRVEQRVDVHRHAADAFELVHGALGAFVDVETSAERLHAELVRFVGCLASEVEKVSI
jgi:hypothetical protein